MWIPKFSCSFEILILEIFQGYSYVSFFKSNVESFYENISEIREF